MVQFISKHNECEKFAQHEIYFLYIFFVFCPRVRSAFFALSDNELKPKAVETPKSFKDGRCLNLGFCKQIVMADSKFFIVN